MVHKISKTQRHHVNAGFALLLAVLLSSILLAVGMSILNIAIKEITFANLGRDSEIAFYAADAGVECALYWDSSSQGGRFDIGESGESVTCVGDTPSITNNGATNIAQTFELEWGTTNVVCAKVSVTKYFSSSAPVAMGGGETCSQGVVCTKVESRGYNTSCSLGSARVVERALKASY